MSDIVYLTPRPKPAPAPIDTAFLDGMAARKCAQIEAAAYAVAALAATPSQKLKAEAIARQAASLAAEFNPTTPPGGAAA